MNTGRARPASRTQDPTDTFTSDMPCPERDETGFQVCQAYITFMIHAKIRTLQVMPKIIHVVVQTFSKLIPNSTHFLRSKNIQPKQTNDKIQNSSDCKTITLQDN